MENKQDQNLHTLKEIQEAGNRYIRTDFINGEMVTMRGKTMTKWIEKERHYWYPVTAWTPDIR